MRSTSVAHHAEEQRQVRARASPLGMEGNGWDLANTVVYLLSNASRFVIGQTLVMVF